jgi:SNF2 family DNA or RNA helicase
MLVTYDILLKDVDVFVGIDWQIVIVDEGHRIKNSEGKKHKALSCINAMTRFILTGTPIQNSLPELYNLLHFVSPQSFTDMSLFPEDDIESIEDDIIQDLKTLIAAHLKRRSLADVEQTVLPKLERVAFLKLTDCQKTLIRLTKLQELSRVARGGDETKGEAILIQRICNHPFLISGAREYFGRHLGISKSELLINLSAKLIFLDRILPVFKRNGNSDGAVRGRNFAAMHLERAKLPVIVLPSPFLRTIMTKINELHIC